MQPDAYLIRELRHDINGKPIKPGTIMCGKMFMAADTARAAAQRLSNSWRTCHVEPVFTMKTIDDDITDRRLEASTHD